MENIRGDTASRWTCIVCVCIRGGENWIVYYYSAFDLSDSKLECLKPYNFQRECVKKIFTVFWSWKNGKKGIKSGKVCKNSAEKFSPLRDLNSRPLVYKTSALTTELKRLLVGEELNNVGLFPVNLRSGRCTEDWPQKLFTSDQAF